MANPAGDSVAVGGATITNPSATQTVINQTSKRALINWNSFSIPTGASVVFNQPNSKSLTVNRVTGRGSSTIDGSLFANGNIWLLNANGILFGKGSQINVGSLLATTSELSDADFKAGNNNFTPSPNPNASAINQGTITASRGGSVVLSAPLVSNEGLIQADLGTVVLGGAQAFTVDMTGDNLLRYEIAAPVTPAPKDANGSTATGLVSNSGTISAAGGHVLMTAQAARNVEDSVINNTGMVEATSVSVHDGEVDIDAGDGTVNVGGTVDVSGAGAGQTGGTVTVVGSTTSVTGEIKAGGGLGASGGHVETSGHTLSVGGAKVDAGVGGDWLLDPYDLTVDDAAASTIDASLGAGTNVTLRTTANGASGPGTSNSSGNGDIFINSPVNWNTGAKFTLIAYRNIDINADIVVAGGGRLVLTTGTGAAGNYQISSGNSISFTAGASSGATLAINGLAYRLLYSAAAIQSIDGSDASLQGNFALAHSVNASAISDWVPIGTDGQGNIENGGSGFAGTFAGLGNTISNLNVDIGSNDYAGLFGFSSGTLRDVYLHNETVLGGNNVGGLSGYSTGQIFNAGVSGNSFNLDGIVGANYVGGLVGQSSGTILQSFSAIPIADTASGQYFGGLVGANSGSVANSYSTGDVSDFDATAQHGIYIGGLVGSNTGDITNAYSTGTLTTRGGSNVGGFAGFNSGTLSNVFTIGSIDMTPGTSHGGLVGLNHGTITHGYWDVDTSGLTAGVSPNSKSDGTVGLTTASGPNPFQADAYAGFDFASGTVWNIVPGLSVPYLQFQFPDGAPQVISGVGLRAPNVPPPYTPSPYLHGFTVGALVDGIPVGVASMGDNGYYEMLLKPGTISATGSQVLAYIVGTASTTGTGVYNPTGDSFFDDATGSVSGLNIFGHYVALYSGAPTVTAMVRDLAKALGPQSGNDFIFSVGNAPNYTLSMIDPVGLPTGSSLIIYSSAGHLNLDQVPKFGSDSNYFALQMSAADAVVTQSAPIDVGRLSLSGIGATFTLNDPDNSFVQMAADAANIDITDSRKLVVSEVNTIVGVTADKFKLNDPVGMAQSQPLTVDNLALIGGKFKLLKNTNDIGTLAGNLDYLDLIDSAALTIGTVGSVSGLKVSGQAILKTIGTNSDVSVDDELSATALLTLVSSAGIFEDSDTSISAPVFTGSSATGVDLQGTNRIGVLHDFTNRGTGDITIVNDQTLSILGSITEVRDGGAISLTTTRANLVVGGAGSLSASTINLSAGSKAIENSTGKIKADLLNVTAESGIQLIGNNNITAVGTDHTDSGPNTINPS